MDSKFTMLMPSKIGDLILEFEDEQLLSLSIEESSEQRLGSNIKSNSKLEKSIRQPLENYFSSSIPFETITLSPKGTSFQKAVWRELTQIPLGETRTYGEIANKLHSSPRAVGNACRKNPIAIIIPCHRVVSAKGIGGYAGATEGKQLNIKRWLLNHEGVQL